MWLDQSHLAGAIAKAPRPPATALYRIVLAKKAGAPAVEGMSDTEYLGTGSMVSRATGTIIASPGFERRAYLLEKQMTVAEAFNTFKSNLEITQGESRGRESQAERSARSA